MAARLAREEGLLCGPSSGINVVAALKVADKHPEFHRIVTVIADTGQRYLSGELFGERPDVEEPDRDHEIDAETLQRVASSPRPPRVPGDEERDDVVPRCRSRIARSRTRARRFIDDELIPWEVHAEEHEGQIPRTRGATSPPGDRARAVRDEHAEGARRRRDDHAPADARLRAARPRDQRARLVRAHPAGVGARRRARPSSSSGGSCPPIRGERHECYAITEEGAGSDVDAIAATVRRDGDEYVLNGTKMHVTSFNSANYCFFQGKIVDGDARRRARDALRGPRHAGRPRGAGAALLPHVRGPASDRGVRGCARPRRRTSSGARATGSRSRTSGSATSG